MYVGIDIGGTKTLVAALTNEGAISESAKFPTPEDYPTFLVELAKTVAGLTTKDFKAGAVAAPGEINRKKGIFVIGGNLKWRNEPIQRDVEHITHCPMVLENDANLAGLSEAMLLKDKCTKVLYLTISTGIGGGYIVNQRIDSTLADIEPGQMMVQRGNKMVKWESFASGKAIYEKYHLKASEIDDPTIWQAVVKNWTAGFISLLAITQPDIVVLGGGVGHYLPKYHSLLIADIKQHITPVIDVPPIIKAQRPEEAVVYGCYDIARTTYA